MLRKCKSQTSRKLLQIAFKYYLKEYFFISSFEDVYNLEKVIENQLIVN